MIFGIVLGDTLSHQLQRIATVKSELPGIIADEVTAAGSELVAELGSAAPRSGTSTSGAIEGDASGPLAESFSSDVQSDGNGIITLMVKTAQPTKLKFVREGTGLFGPLDHRIYPKVKRALFWEGAAHPVRSVAGQHPNDFVTPITESAGDIINERVAAVISETLQLLVT